MGYLLADFFFVASCSATSTTLAMEPMGHIAGVAAE